MEIYGAGGMQGPQPIYTTRMEPRSVINETAIQSAIPRDQVEISALAQMLESVSQLPDIRYERVESIRQELAMGTYETSAKLEMALERLLEELMD